MLPEELTLGVVFFAGVASFLSPCVLPVMPGYLSYLTARASGANAGRREVFLHGAAFVLGFSAVFLLMGAAASALGTLLYGGRIWLSRIGGVLIILFGLHLAGILRLPALEREWRLRAEPNPAFGYASSFLMGAAFSAGWTACIGPILGVVLTLAAAEASFPRGMLFLGLYSLGMAIPFLLLAAALDRLGGFVRRLGRVSRFLSIASGILFAIVGVLLLSGRLNLLAQILPVVETG